MEKIDLINDCSANSLGHREKYVLSEALKSMFTERGLGDELPDDNWACPTFHDLIEELTGYQSDPEWKSYRKSIDGVLAAVETAFGSRVFNQSLCLSGRDFLIGESIRVMTGHLSQREQAVVTEAIVRSILARAKELGPLPMPPANKSESVRIVVLIDEAHLLNVIGSPDAPGRVLNSIVREGRKFGVSIVLATQGVMDLSEAVRKNASSWMVFRLIDHQDAAIIARKFKVKVDAFGCLKNAREAFFWDGSSPSACRIELPLTLGMEESCVDYCEDGLIPKDYGKSFI